MTEDMTDSAVGVTGGAVGRRTQRDPRGDLRSPKKLARALAVEQLNGGRKLSGRQWKKLKRALRQLGKP